MKYAAIFLVTFVICVATGVGVAHFVDVKNASGENMDFLFVLLSGIAGFVVGGVAAGSQYDMDNK